MSQPPPTKKFADNQSLVVVPQESTPKFEVVETDSSVQVVTSQLIADVLLSTGDVKFYDSEGKLILAEDEGGRRFTRLKSRARKPIR